MTQQSSFFQLILILLTIWLMASPPWAWSQTPGNTSDQKESSFHLGFKVGSLLPYKIKGLRENLPLWGLRMGHGLTDHLSLEYNFDKAQGEGLTYYLGYLSLRQDLVIGKTLPLFVLMGLDAHYYTTKQSLQIISTQPTQAYEISDFRFTSGYHFGFGGETFLYEHLVLRSDFRMGINPKLQLVVSLGAAYRF